MTRVLVITGDPVGPRMAGPAIRAWNIAQVLAVDNEVSLMTTTTLDPVDAPFAQHRVKPGEDAAFARLLARADVIVFQGHAMAQFDALRTTEKIVVADIYDPMHLEMLEQGRELGRATWDLRVRTATDVLNEQLALADFFLCASERQRLFYLGQLAALGRITPSTYEHDPHLSRLLAIVPFGLDAEPPVHRRNVLKGTLPGIGSEDRVVIWGGGVYSWFDPRTLIRAMAQLALRRDDARLFFLGTRHPGVEAMGIVRESLDLATELGLLDSTVFFNEDWVQYVDRGDYLSEADAGVSTHFSHVETEFSFRTRILDYLWASLPMVVTQGDGFAELIEREGLGVVVPPEDVDALAAALERVLYDEAFIEETRRNIHAVRERFTWERVLAPLVDFVRDPTPAADRAGRSSRVRNSRTARKRHGALHDLRMTWHHLRHAGVRPTLDRIALRLRRGS
ncbi:MAG: glycosyltransferase [Rhodoglobus sp.]